MKVIFVNKNSQIRSGWKIVITYTAFFVGTNIITFFGMLAYMLFMISTKRISMDNLMDFSKSMLSGGNMFMIAGIIQCTCMILSVFLFWKIFDKRPVKDLGLINIKSGFRDMLTGLMFGAVSMTVVFLILLATGNITLVEPLSRPNTSLSLLSGLVLFIFVGINEELFSRGYCMTVLKQTGKRWIVVLISSLLFALMHSLNPNMSYLSYLNLFLVGVLFAYMFIKSGNLWLPIGYHITWNYFQGDIFGFQVSGLGVNSLFRTKIPVENVMNGGLFGPEGGLVVTLAIILGFAYMYFFYKPAIVIENEKLNTQY